MDEVELKKKKLECLVRQCIIILDYFIERDRRRGKVGTFSETLKEHLKKTYEQDKDNIKLLSRNISGYRMSLKDLKEDAREFLKEKEQVELKQRILDELGSDAV